VHNKCVDKNVRERDRVGAYDRKTKACRLRDSRKARVRCVIFLIRHLSRIFMSLNNPKAARVFTQEIKSHVQRPDGNFLFARCRRNLFCPDVGADICIYISSRSFGDAITTRKNNGSGTKFANGCVKHPWQKTCSIGNSIAINGLKEPYVSISFDAIMASVTSRPVSYTESNEFTMEYLLQFTKVFPAG